MLNRDSAIRRICTIIEPMIDDDVELDRPSEQTFQDIGFNSLALARLLIKLEREFGFDPFHEGAATLADVKTLGDLADIYSAFSSQPVRA